MESNPRYLLTNRNYLVAYLVEGTFNGCASGKNSHEFVRICQKAENIILSCVLLLSTIYTAMVTVYTLEAAFSPALFVSRKFVAKR